MAVLVTAGLSPPDLALMLEKLPRRAPRARRTVMAEPSLLDTPNLALDQYITSQKKNGEEKNKKCTCTSSSTHRRGQQNFLRRRTR
jgi:hypothetical protein